MLFAVSLSGVSSPPGATSAGGAATYRAEFDAASIRVHREVDEDSNTSLDWGVDRFVARNESLKDVLELAYDLKPYQVTGIPEALDGVRFDIEAKLMPDDAGVAANVTYKQLQRLLPFMLAERFALRAHLEMKTRPVYELEVAKGGLKMLPAKPGEKAGLNLQWSGATKELKGTASSIGDLIELLEEQVVPRTVIDRTKMTGSYDFSLSWAAEDAAGDDSDGGASFFTAIQEQLGLRLRPMKAPLKVLAIDHIEMPSEN